jgi:glycosyltransferase involved in cell wall biosynthesis
MCLDPEFWKPDLTVPNHLKIKRSGNELVVYHSFGNYDLRTAHSRNIKGTGAIQAAVERLQAEGMAVRLNFVTGVKNTEVRYLQAQADVVVDQLNYGRYGATAREAMMLGKPTICYINRSEPKSADVLRSTQELPLVSATEETIYNVLGDLLVDSERRRRLGDAGRAFAMKWHSADACAERYEAVYDSLMGEQFGGRDSKPEKREACKP